MPTLDLDLIKARLFEDRKIVDRLTREYGLDPPPDDPENLAGGLTGAFGQTPVANPLVAEYGARQVFRAAVGALASNARSWSTFLKFERCLTERLHDYDPVATWEAVQNGALRLEAIKECLPGQTGGSDAKAISRWAEMLHSTPDYYQRLADLGHAFAAMDVRELEIMPCVAGFLGEPPRRSKVVGRLKPANHMLTPADWKLAGMRAVLGSEFLRNLGWSGFKPDRHVTRLFGRWFPDVVKASEPRAAQLADLIGRKTRDLLTYLTYSLVGIAVTPAGHTLSEADNLVWALGAYVERKGRETDQPYRAD